MAMSEQAIKQSRILSYIRQARDAYFTPDRMAVEIVKRAHVRGLIDLRGAVLRDADLSGANLRDADLSGADLRGADLRGADLRDANLRDADLGDTSLDGADLIGADLRGTCLDPSAEPCCTDEQIRDAGLEVVDGYVYGYRTRTSQHCGRTKYVPGTSYTAPVFSVSTKPCHPGIYIASREWLDDIYGSVLARVLVRCRREDIHCAGDKFRAKAIEVVAVAPRTETTEALERATVE